MAAVLAGAVVVSPLAALPAAAAPATTLPAATPRAELTYEDHGFPGYFSELSIVEDTVSASADHFTVQADFCVHPQAGEGDRIGFDILWNTPISDWEDVVGLDQSLTSRVPVKDDAGRTVMTATMAFDASEPIDEDDWARELKTSVDLSPVAGAAPKGGCGTLRLPVAAPLMLSDVVAAQPTLPGEEDFDPYAYLVQFVDPEGRRSEDEVSLTPADLPVREAWAEGTLDFTGSTTWVLLSQAGPANAGEPQPTVTVQDGTLCEEPYEAVILDSASLQPLNLEPDLDVSCEDGVKTFTLQNRLRADRQLLIAQQDPCPGARPATAELTADFTVNGDTVTRTASVVSAAPAGRVTGAWTAPALCSATPFRDNGPGSLYRREVRWMQCWEISQGYGSDHTFRKNRPITRGESVAFLSRYALNVGPVFPVGVPGELPPIDEPAFFWDVDEDHTFFEPVAWAAAMGLTQGYQDGSFGVSRPVTRGELAAFVYRLVDGGFSDDGSPAGTRFRDVPAGHAFDAEIAWLAEEGIIRGYADGRFRPSRQISRGEVARVLHQVHDQFVRRP